METGTYKVGDRVIVSSKLLFNDPHYGASLDPDRMTFCDRPVTIVRIVDQPYGSQTYKILEDRGKWLWISRWMKCFEPSVKQKDICKLLASP